MGKYDVGNNLAIVGLVGLGGYLLYKVFTATKPTATEPPPATGVTSFRELLVSQYS